MSNSYFIATEIPAVVPLNVLVASLQEMYDTGAAGDFHIVETQGQGYMVIFKRDTGADAEYVTVRFNENPEKSSEFHAQQQLANELSTGETDSAVGPIVAVLKEGRGNCFDFCMGNYEKLIGCTG